jgi:fermentation-respiration switch protein FrsA (DUF1100 family)
MASNIFLRKAVRVIITLMIFYIVVLFIACIFQEKLIFHPEKLSADYSYNLSEHDKEVMLQTKDGEKINAILFTNPKNKNVILYFHGNAGSLGNWQFIWQELMTLDCNLFIIDYRCYGKSTGKFSENGFYIDAETAYEYLLENGYTSESIIIYGRSLGSGVAVNLAINKKAKALILETPFSALKDLAKEKYSFLFPGLFLKYDFDNFSKMENLAIPALLIHGDNDNIIPLSHSKVLFEKIKGAKQMFIVKGGGHNNLAEFPEYNNTIANFLYMLPEKNFLPAK